MKFEIMDDSVIKRVHELGKRIAMAEPYADFEKLDMIQELNAHLEKMTFEELTQILLKSNKQDGIPDYLVNHLYLFARIKVKRLAPGEILMLIAKTIIYSSLSKFVEILNDEYVLKMGDDAKNQKY